MGFNKTLGQAFLIMLLAIASYQLLHESNHASLTTLKAETDQTEKPSAFIQNGEFTIYDKSGDATHLSSKKAHYYSNPKRILIDSPSISFHTSDNQTITLNANTGTFHPEQEKLFLKGKVIVQRTPLPTSDPSKPRVNNNTQTPDKNAKPFEIWTLESEEFELNNQTHFISTDQAVTMTKGKSSIQAVGLNAWIDEKKIELLSEVRGRYVFN
ncbi:MAG: lipopolysaccharide export system protein LptC [Pseudohongiellaceae bacterium]|jgi:lipopolysaccharide export system protein LptC